MSASALQAADNGRVLQARLQIVIDSLQATFVFNPLVPLLCLPAFLVNGSPFGHVPLTRLGLAEGLQLLSASAAFFIHRRYRRVEAKDLSQIQQLLLAAQVLVSGAWGAMVFLLWLPGNPVNQVFVVMLMSIICYAAVFTRSMHLNLLATALITQGGLTMLRLVTSPDLTAHILMPVILLYTAYLWMMGKGSNRQIDALVRARIANEDMAGALRQARDEALHKRYEAETANASKTAFLANMSHELRTPLNAILGFSEIIARQSLGPDRMARYSEYAADIHASGDHLLSLINDMLDVAKIESGRMEIEPRWIDPAQALDGAYRLMAPRALQKRQMLAMDVPSDIPLVWADERAMRQMLLNLLSNAVKFTPEGGHITMTCCATLEGGLEVKVQDDGPGIPQEKLARVLEPFSQIDNRFDREAGGTGLGLALVDGLVRLHGGRISLASKLGAGVLATLYFPSTKADQAQRASA